MISPAKLNQRQLIGEQMDQPGLRVDEHQQALQGLGRINRLSRTTATIWKPLDRLARQSTGELRVLDLATGGGDLPIALWLRGKRAGRKMHIEGCDISATAVQFAANQARQSQAEVNFFQLNLLTDPMPHGFDVILCSLFLHHLDDQSLVQLLEKIRRHARQMLIASDLRRCLGGYLLAWAGTRLLSRSRIVHDDGPLSVRSAFTASEIQILARQAGLQDIVIENRWPYRFLIVWNKK